MGRWRSKGINPRAPKRSLSASCADLLTCSLSHFHICGLSHFRTFTPWHFRIFRLSPFRTFSRCHFSTALLVTSALLATACAPNDLASARFEPIAFPDSSTVPRVVVHGSLTESLPRYDATPALDLFLHGPNDFGKMALRNPQGMAVAGRQLLVCDQGWPDVIAIDLLTGRSLTWSDRENPPRCPVDVAVDEDGRVYVADTTRHAVLVYDSKGEFIQEITPSADPQRRFRPCAVLVRADMLYIGNLGDRRVDRYDLTAGRWLEAITPPPAARSMVAPTGLAMDAAGVLLIVDAVQSFVWRLAPTGEWLPPLGKPGRLAGEFVRPKQIITTPSGLILVSDAGRQSVLVFDGDGRHLFEIHERENGWRGFTLPMGLVVLPADTLSNRATDTAEKSSSIRNDGEYVVVSDSLGGMSLTLLSIVTSTRTEVADAK